MRVIAVGEHLQLEFISNSFAPNKNILLLAVVHSLSTATLWSGVMGRRMCSSKLPRCLHSRFILHRLDKRQHNRRHRNRTDFGQFSISSPKSIVFQHQHHHIRITDHLNWSCCWRLTISVSISIVFGIFLHNFSLVNNTNFEPIFYSYLRFSCWSTGSGTTLLSISVGKWCVRNTSRFAEHRR